MRGISRGNAAPDTQSCRVQSSAPAQDIAVTVSVSSYLLCCPVHTPRSVPHNDDSREHVTFRCSSVPAITCTPATGVHVRCDGCRPRHVLHSGGQGKVN